jgi:hypothetical protein
VLHPSLAFRARALMAAGRQQEADREANELLAMLAQQGVLPTAPDWSGDLVTAGSTESPQVNRPTRGGDTLACEVRRGIVSGKPAVSWPVVPSTPDSSIGPAQG